MLICHCKIKKIQPKQQYYNKRIEDIQNFEKYIAVNNNEENKDTEKWSVIQNDVQNVPGIKIFKKTKQKKRMKVFIGIPLLKLIRRYSNVYKQ